MKTFFKKKKATDTPSGDARRRPAKATQVSETTTGPETEIETESAREDVFSTIPLGQGHTTSGEKTKTSSFEKGRSILQSLGHSSSSASGLSSSSSTDKQRVQQAFNDVDILFSALMSVLDIHPADQEKYLQLNDAEKWHLVLTHNDRLGSVCLLIPHTINPSINQSVKQR